MRNISALIAFVGLFGAGIAWADDNDDRGLIHPAAAEAGQVQTATPRATTDLAQAERQARIDMALAQTRLELVLARKELRVPEYRGAATRAVRVLALLKELPAEIDVSVYGLQAEGILALAEKAGVDVAALRAEAAGKAIAPLQDDYLDRQAQAAAKVSHGYSGADRDEIDSNANAQTLRQRTLRRQTPADYGYRPGKEIVDTTAILERDRQRGHYEAALRKAYKADEARLLTEADEARVVPDGDVAYPDDWPEKVAKRAKYAGGEVARSDSWIDDEGREWFVAVYDIRDLIYVPPDFQPPFSLDPVEDLRNAMDREALRWNGGMFDGYYAEDLAAGIPLLRYFGGTDDFALRGPKYSAERQQQIVEMISAFTTQKSEAKIIPLAP